MSELSHQIVEVSARYLGPEAKRFLERQTQHMEEHVTLETLQKEHLLKFAWWCGVSGKLIMGKEKAAELQKKITEL